MLRIVIKIIISIILLIAVTYISIHIIIRPSHNRDWSVDQAILPSAEINGSEVLIHNIRNFSYASTTSYTPDYYDKKFNLDKIKKAYFVVEPFSGYVGAAHTLVSFEFEDGEFVAVSAEIRKEKGESFSAVKGMLNQYELMYVIADEKDVVKLRSNYRHDNVYVYPIKATKEKIREVFLDMILRANNIAERPEFYNTLTNTCTTNIVSHINKISPKKIPFSLKILFPENADKLAYDLNMIDTDLSFEDARVKYLINERALKYADDPDFSKRIRE